MVRICFWYGNCSAYLENIEKSIIYQLFLNGHEQLAKTEVKESQVIASVRVY